MHRYFSLFGFAALFLLISPGLRGHLFGGIGAFVLLLEDNSPWSYVLCVICVFAIFGISLSRSAAPR